MQRKNFNAIPLWALFGMGRYQRQRAFESLAVPGPQTPEDHERIAKAQAKRERKNARRLREVGR